MKAMVSTFARRAAPAAIAFFAARSADASFLSGDALDTMADWVAIVVLCIVPVGALVLFWLVHVLPEKVAEKRHHPQKDAITTLCLLSLAFGGLLWLWGARYLASDSRSAGATPPSPDPSRSPASHAP